MSFHVVIGTGASPSSMEESGVVHKFTRHQGSISQKTPFTSHFFFSYASMLFPVLVSMPFHVLVGP